MKLHILYIFLSVFFSVKAISQISPPGMGEAQTAEWFAVGVRQELDTLQTNGWQSMSYVGIGRKSNPNIYNPFYKPSIVVVNQEFYHQFQKDWQYTMALSYRRQNEYAHNLPYEPLSPKLKQEFRLYGRLSYIYNTTRIKLMPTFRQEFRKFLSSNFNNLDEDFQLRSRFRLQLTVNLDDEKRNRLIASSEQLFSISKENSSNSWSKFNYQESRFSLYYSYSPKTIPLVLSIGYMNNLLGQQNPENVNYLAFDIVIENIF